MKPFRLDQAAIAISGLCIVHCVASLAGLFAVGLLSTFGWVDEWFHRALLLVILPTSTLALFSGYRQHRRAGMLLSGILALTMLTTLTTFEEALHGSVWEPVLTTLAGFCLILSHILNIRSCRQCDV
ncbi:MerC domain-containing protein [Alloalcanivorax xenomutans]|uniref:MerC domain-containing protein n=1 Tax=Alloalcanivorax xenomutans TaxID=1094342 RepID=UPI003D9BD8F4